MKKLFCKGYLYNVLVMIISLFAIEIINKLISGSAIFSFSSIRILLGLLIFSLVVNAFLIFTNRKVSKIVISIIVFAFSVYSCAQAGFFNFLGVYMSFQTSSQLGAVTSYIKDFLMSFHFYYFSTFIPFILLILYYIFVDKKFNYNYKVRAKTLFFLGVILVVDVLAMGYYASVLSTKLQSKLQTVSNEVLFLTANNPTVTIDQFGTLGFCFLDIKSMLFPVTITEEFEVKQEHKSEHNELSREIDDEAWEMLIKEEENNEINSINKYLISRNITDKNQMTGIFEGKNLIVIMMESVNDIFINPEYYPNFYKLVSEGWYFENNYSPRNSCATMNNEFSGMTSLYSIYNTCTASKYKSNTYFDSMFNLFNQEDYVTFSAHNYTQAYYPRKAIHTNMGSGEYYGVEKLGIKYSNSYVNWSNDDDFMKAWLKILDKKTKKGDNFMSWLTTVSSHQPYSSSSIQGDKYYNLTKGTGYDTDVRRFMSKLKILDNGLGVLLEGLKSRGILDDTVIVLYGDHYPYGISKKHLNKVLDYNTSTDLNAERVPLVIYNSEIEGQAFSQYTSYMNLLPTLANLFNLDYDPRLYMGTDMFSEDFQSLTVFADGSWKNENAFYNASKTKIKYYSSFTYSDEEIRDINMEISQEMSMSSKIIKNNYFKYLEKKLKENKEKIASSKNTMCSIKDELKKK